MRNNVWKKISNLDQPIFCGHDLVNSGMRIVHENTNFCGSETDCGEKWKKKKNVCGYQTKKCQGDQTNTKKGSTGFSFTRETYGVHSHMAIAHLSCSIVNTVTGSYFHGQALGLNTVLPTRFCAMFWLRKNKGSKSFESERFTMTVIWVVKCG